MDSSSSTSNSDVPFWSKEGFPWAGTAAVLIILAIEWVFYHPLWSVRAGRHHADRIVAAKVHYVQETPPADMLLLGDSSVSTALDAAYLSRRYPGVNFVNLGLVGSTSMAGTYFMAARYLENHPPPKAAFIMFSPLTLNYDVGELIWNRRLMRFFHRPAEIFAYAPFCGLDAACRAMLHNLLPSSEWSDFFWNFPREDLKTWTDIQTSWTENGEFYPQLVATRGFTPVTENEPFHQRDFRLSVSPINQHFLDQLIRELQGLEVEVYFAFPPLPESRYQLLQADQQALRSWSDYLDSLKTQGVLAWPMPAWFPDKDFGSLYHLKESATPAFNQQHAAGIQDIVEGWMAPASVEE